MQGESGCICGYGADIGREGQITEEKEYVASILVGREGNGKKFRIFHKS